MAGPPKLPPLITINVKTAHHLDRDTVCQISKKALNVYAPVAHTRGLDSLATTLENQIESG
jgi:hypothetical protein